MTSKETLFINDIPVDIFRKPNLKNLYIHVDPPEGTVSVKAPLDVTTSEIELFLLKKLPEVSKAKEHMVSQPRQTKRSYITGEAHYLWGKPYKLQVVYGASKPYVAKEGAKLVMYVPDGTSEIERKHLMTEWYRAELKSVLNIVAKRCEQRTGIAANEFRIKNMKTKWGTCNIKERRIWVNLQLVKKPPECLDYVLVHELVHLLESNHTNRFQSLVEEFYPIWQEAKTLLNSMPLDYIDSSIGTSDVD